MKKKRNDSSKVKYSFYISSHAYAPNFVLMPASDIFQFAALGRYPLIQTIPPRGFEPAYCKPRTLESMHISSKEVYGGGRFEIREIRNIGYTQSVMTQE